MASGLVPKKEGWARRLRHGCRSAWRSVVISMVVGDPKQQDQKTNEVDSMTILWARLAKAGLAWPRGELDDG